MINRDNWKDVNEYLDHIRRIGRDEETVNRVRTYLRYLLYWADSAPFTKVKDRDPSFPVYLTKHRFDGRTDKMLSATTLKKTCEYVRLFFGYIKGNYPIRYKMITQAWIDTITPPISRGVQSEFHEHDFYSIEMMHQIASYQVTTVKQERDRAAACFLFLSAMRAQAFVSMPINCVDLQNYQVLQLPQMGVRTKNRKAAKTQMLRIPELLQIVNTWDEKVRRALGPTGLWYASLDQFGAFVPQNPEEVNWLSRREIMQKGIRDICELAGVKYLSPHKFRHGHIYYMMGRVQDLKQLKALSQNVMHSSVSITDGIYGKLISDDIKTIYGEISEG
jgi:site-specific recombinase XerD